MENNIEKEDIYEFYNQLLLKYIDKQLGLSEKEKKMAESIYQLKPIYQDEKDSYQLRSYLNYFYICNGLRIENLTDQEFMLLKNRLDSNKKELDKDAESLIEQTYSKIIDIPKEENKPFKMPEYISGKEHIILVLKTNPEYEKGIKSNPRWLNNYINQGVLIKAIEKEIKMVAKKKDLKIWIIDNI